MTASILDNPAVSRVHHQITTSNRLMRLLDESCKTALGISYLQALALCLVAEGHDSPGAIARITEAHSQTTTGILDRLEAAKLIERRRDRPDRRQVSLVLTHYGSSLAGKARKHIAASEAAIREVL